MIAYGRCFPGDLVGLVVVIMALPIGVVASGLFAVFRLFGDFGVLWNCVWFSCFRFLLWAVGSCFGWIAGLMVVLVIAEFGFRCVYC